MNAIDLLIGDHNRVRGLFAQFRAAHEAEDTATAATVVKKIIADLEAHTTIEEEIFYPAVRPESDEINEEVAEGLEEHHVVKVLIEELSALTPGSEEWTAKVQVMIENVEHHAGEEEEELFPDVRSATDASVLEKLGQKLETRKRALGAPTTADTEGLTKDVLIDLAKDQEIPGRSTMTLEELARTVDARELASH